MICPHCGRSGVPEDARFCPFCTEPVGSPPEEGEPTPGAALDERGGVADSGERALVAATHFADFELRAWSQQGGSVQVLVHNSPVGDMRRPVEVAADLDGLRGIRQTLDTIQRRRPVPRDDSQLSESSLGLHLIAQAGLERGQALRTLEGHSGWVNAVAVYGDGRRAISASEDHTLKVWDLEAGVSLATFSGDSSLQTCAVAPDGRTVVAGDAGGQVHILRLEGGEK